MALIEDISFKNQGRIILWKIEEPEEQLLKETILYASDYEQYKSISNKKRKLEWLTVRRILTYAGISSEVAYSADGKPSVSHNPFKISISHSKNYAVVFISEMECGTDIEEISDRIERIRHKFLSEKEERSLSTEHRLRHLFLNWSAKESAVKLYGKRSFIFDKELNVEDFKPEEEGSFNLFVRSKEIHEDLVINYQANDNFVLVWTIKPENENS